MPKFKIEFKEKKGFEKKLIIECQDEPTAWEWAQKQADVWVQKIGINIKKLKIYVSYF